MVISITKSCGRSNKSELWLVGSIITKLDMRILGYGKCLVQGNRKCQKHIIVDNSSTEQGRNVRLVPT